MIHIQRLRVLTALFIFTVLGSVSFGQYDWDNYKILKASGKVPEIFRTSTEDKIEQDRSKEREMGTSDKERFLEYIHYNMDELLGSGLVLFGDPCTDYVRRVADNLLKNEPKLKKELQFYVIKSNLTNALSTDQGIIFVTMGLLAQIENEAQLAYVISHEISHYQEKHVEESYTNTLSLRRESSYDSRIQAMSNHSKESELEADKLGIKLYHEAGYKKSELLSTFDVLMYSYLPFDEVALPKDYFNTDLIFIPEIYFPETVNPILAEEEYDDDKSTHPNIRKRKKAILEVIGEYQDWGSKEFIVDQAEFEKVRKIARFEGVHRDLLDGNYADALYSIFLLEREDPDSRYLAKCKAQAWLGLAAFKAKGSFSDAVANPTDVEGESHAMYFLLRKFSKLQLYTIAMREIEDVHKKYPSDAELALIRKSMIRILADYSSFKTEKYRAINYETALQRFEDAKNPEKSDSVREETELVDTNKVLSKYDKIKLKREAENTDIVITEEGQFDEEEFYLYAISDLVLDDGFKDQLKACKDEREAEEDKERELRNMSSRDRRKLEREKAYLGLQEIIFMKPIAVQWYYNDVQVKESAELENRLRESFFRNAERTGMKVHDFSNAEINALTTEQYNRQSLLTDYLRQKAAYEGEDMMPVDYEELKAVSKAYENTPLLFVFADFHKTMATRRTELVFLVMDLNSGDLKRERIFRFYQNPGKHLLDSYMYDVLNGLGESKSKKK